MTVTTNSAAKVDKVDDLVSLTIDGFELQVPKGTLVIQIGRAHV